MELDVHLTREAEEPWGFDFYGGSDYGAPLTIDKVEPLSPAHAAGLQPGDIVTRVGDKLATQLSRQDARQYVAEAVGSLAFGVTRGLYDPVLDDFEALYEPTERADSDLRSEPTEVSPPRCIDFPERPLSDLTDFCPINDPKSRTASPFIPNTKPYRPFSTEPLNVPTLEDPIILNPTFKDNFGDFLDGIDIDKVETKFKLPVSEKYDPSYRKKVDGILEKSMEREIKGSVDVEEAINTNTFKAETFDKTCFDINIEQRKQKDEIELMEEEYRFEEAMKLEIDMENIERTALNVVDESIERAVSVTEEIQKEVEVELRASATRETKEAEVKTEECKLKDSVANIELISSEVETKNEIFEELEDKAKTNETEDHEMRAEKPKELLYVRENKNKIKTHEVKTEMNDFERRDYEDVHEVKRGSERKQKSFDIGLQTIPNIRGMAQSSHHFDLLMRTFFIHLTDVMVALSRFILTQPAFELEMKAERVIREKLITGLEREEVNRDMKQEYHQESSSALKREVTVKQEEAHKEKCKVEVKSNQEVRKSQECKKHSESSHNYVDEETERKRLSGAQMAQMTQRKPKELTHRMDAVITEFETKTGIDERLEVTGENRRSRSRSRIEEEVMNESDPLEWLDKVNNKHVAETNISSSKKSFSSHSQSTESRRSEHESKEVRTTKTKPGKQMYVAIVEAHTYTNKDAILEEQMAEISETASIESTEEINTALEEKQQAVEVITQALELAVAESTTAMSESKHEYIDVKESRIEKASLSEESYKTAAVETNEMTLESSKEFKETKVSKHEAVSKQEILTSVASESTEIVEDLKTESFEVSEVFEKKAIVVSEENYKATAVHSSETVLEECSELATELKVSEKQATSKVEQLNIATAESTDIVADDSKTEIFEAEAIESNTAVIKSEESFKTAAIETSEVLFEEAVEEHAVSIETGHATIRETCNLAVAGIIETKTEEDKVIVPKPAEDEYASLKIIKQEVIEPDGVDFTEISESELNIKKTEIENYSAEKISIHESEKLYLRTDLQTVLSNSSIGSDENNNTPSPSTVPPTPLTDEYVFKLLIPLPKNSEVIIKEDSPDNIDREDLSIVKKKLVPHIETSIDDQIIYDPPLPTPTEDKIQPVYSKPGLKGGSSIACVKKEYIREIERKSSLLASAIDETIRSIEEYKEEVGMPTVEKEEVITEEDENEDGEPRPEDELPGFRHIEFQPELAPVLPRLETPVNPPASNPREPYINESGEPLGTVQGIVDGLEDAMVDEEVAKELGKPGMTEDKIAELISGESEMLREAHVMGLTRVLSTHMNKPDDSSVDFNKIKPLVESLKDSEVLKALNEEILKRKEEEKKKDERKWTTFLQKPQRPAPRAKSGFNGFLPQEDNEEGPYKVKIVKQPKPKVAPDYKPEVN